MHTLRRSQTSKLLKLPRFISGPPRRAPCLWLRTRLMILIIVAATVTAIAAIAFLAPDMLLLLRTHVPKAENHVIDCAEPAVVRPAIQRAIARDRASLSPAEPLDFRTIVDGNYLPRITKSWPVGFDPYDEEGRAEKILPCTPVLQRGHIVVYTPAEVREILAGRGRFDGQIRPFIPSHHWQQQACSSSVPSIPEAAKAFARPPVPLPVTAGDEAIITTSTTGSTTSTSTSISSNSSNNSNSGGTNSSDSTIMNQYTVDDPRPSGGVGSPNRTFFAHERASYANGDGDAREEGGNQQQEQQQQLPTYTPVVLFADLGYGDEKSMYFENVASEWVLHTVFTPRDTNAFIAAVFFHRQNLSEAFDMDVAREYLRIPGVARVMTTYLISDRRVESCDTVQRLADFVQPHMIIATGDEKATRHCTAKVLSQKCYGADKRCGYGQCALPVTLAEFSSHGTPGVAHVPTWTWPRAEPRAMRRADTPAPPPGWVEFYGWPLPHGISAWAEMYTWGFVCQTYERKIPPPPPAGTYTNENLRPLPCYDLTSRDCLLAPHPKMPSGDLDMACPPPPPLADMDDYYAFPSRHAYPYVLPPLDRPRRLAWSLIGSRLYGDRNSAVSAFSAAFSGIPSLVDDKGFGRFDALSRVVGDSVFVPIGGGNCAYETARAFEVMRAGAIPVVATGAAWSAALGSPSAVPDPASAFTTLLGFEGRWPDGWLVARTWPEAAAMARRVLETPGEVARLRRLVLASYAVLREAMHQRTRLAMSRSVDPAHFWDEAAANLTLSS